jgi:predicted Zn-dependent protease
MVWSTPFLKLLLVVALCCAAGCSTGFSLSAEKCFEEGRQKLKENKTMLAYKYFDAASRKEPANSTYQWAAATAAPDQNSAFIHTHAAWKNGLKRPDVLFALSRLSFHTEKKEALEYTKKLFVQLPDSFQTPLFREQIFFRFEEWDSCLAILLPLFQQKPAQNVGAMIAMVYGKKGEYKKGYSVLQDCRMRKLLDGNGYALLAVLETSEYNFSAADTLFSEARRFGLYTNDIQLQHADLMIAQDRFDEAEKLLSGLTEPVSGRQEDFLNHRARIDIAYVYFRQNKPDKIAALRNGGSESTTFQKTEFAFYKGMLDAAADSSARALNELAELQKALPDNPLIVMAMAFEKARRSQYKEAIAEYKKVPPVYLRSPRVLIEFANALYKNGNDDEALALISSLHQHNLYSRPSLELFRDITFKKHLMDKSIAAQKMLEKKFTGDASVLWSGMVMALKTGKTDSALALATELSKKFPQEERFEIARISMYLVKKEYDRVLRECSQSKASASALAPLEAGAFRAIGKNDFAERAYAKGMAQKKTPALMLDYAGFLIESGKAEQAASLYDEIVAMKKDDLQQDSVMNAMVLNNLAWSLLQTKSFSQDRVIAVARHAHELSPGNPQIIDTYASVLLKNGNNKECIKLLADNAVAVREPRLLFHLATAYEKSHEVNKAVRYYRDALKLMDSASPVVPMTLSKADVRNCIDKLLAPNK